MTEIYLIRHTQAEGNLYHMMQGHWDGNVTSVGQKQIEALAKRFENIKVDAVYSSDLSRAMQTATAVSRHSGLSIIKDKRLREINVGPWEAQFFGNAIHDDPDSFRMFITDPDSFFLEGAETYAQVGQRVYAALSEIAAAHDGKTIAVVSHGVSIRCMLSLITGAPLKELNLSGNTGVSHIYWDNGSFSADYINDVSHLPPELSRPGVMTSFRHEYIDPAEYAKYYEDCYRASWLSAHGDLSGFSPESYLDSAKEHYAADKESILMMFDQEQPAGLIDLDTMHGRHSGYGWISLLYLNENYRSKGLAVQLLARAIVKYEQLGRTAIRLHVSDDNTAALKFYKANGFEQLSYEPRGNHKLFTMEKKLGGKSDV